ncbi:MAG: ABC transporter ATP-binding protein [Pseudomonadota bacterium]
MNALVEIEDLVVVYRARGRSVIALDRARLRIADGETLAIVGESGSGKTTLGMAIGRLLPPEAEVAAGRLDFEGRSLREASPAELRALRRERLGFIFQNPMTALDPTMRIGRQVAFAMGGDASIADVARLLERAELPDAARVARSFPHELSGGMAQRVVIAMAIARSPRLLVADEPTASLDASVRDRVMATLARLRAETGASLVILSHDLRMVAAHADRVAVMYGGRVVELGDSESVLSRPAHPYTRALIAAAAGNERPGERLVPIQGAPPVLTASCQRCAYEPRCAFRRDFCAAARPEERLVDGRQALCHFSEEVLATPRDAAKVETR